MTVRQQEWQSKFEAADKLAAERQAEIEQINARLQTIQEQATARRAQLEAQQAAEPLTAPAQQLSFVTETPPTQPAAKSKEKAVPADDLEIINGIGLVFAKKLKRGGVRTFKQLAQAEPDQLAAIVKAPEWRTPDYASWIEQAKQLAS